MVRVDSVSTGATVETQLSRYSVSSSGKRRDGPTATAHLWICRLERLCRSVTTAKSYGHCWPFVELATYM